MNMIQAYVMLFLDDNSHMEYIRAAVKTCLGIPSPPSFCVDSVF